MPAGRPRKEIDKDNFEKLCGLQCTLDEISGFFNCSYDTIRRFCQRTYGKNFETVYKEHSMVGKISLRRAQMKLAEKSAAMAIFLGKNMLGQKDQLEVEDSRALDKLDEILAGVKEDAVQSEAVRIHSEREQAVESESRSGQEREDVC